MILQSAKIENFKSIGKDNNILYVDASVTALIGKNESGKIHPVTYGDKKDAFLSWSGSVDKVSLENL